MTSRTPFACLVIVTALAAVLLISPGVASAGYVCADSFNPCAPAIELSVNGPYYGNQGTQATYTYHVYNSGPYDASDVVVADDKCSPISGPTGDDGDGLLNPGETWDYTCATTLSDPPGTQVTHDVTADGVSGETPVGDEQLISTWITALHVQKTVDKATADPFDVLNYTITISNDGPDFFGYEGYLSDEGCTSLQTDSENTDGNWWWLDPGQSVTYTCQHTFDPGSGEGQDANPYVNQACVQSSVWNNQIDSVSTQWYEEDLQVCDSASTSLATHSVSGKVFEDMNADGARQAGEPAMPGVVVYADLNGNGVRDSGEPNATSDANGDYTLPVDLGATTIREDVPGGATCSFPSGCAYTVDLPKNSPPAPPSDVLTRPVASRADDPTGKDFGNWRPASVSGTVVGDNNGNGARDAGENGIAGILVFADLDNNGILDSWEPSATTAADGSYTISGLEPGGYVIRHVLVQDGRTCSAPSPNCNYALTLQSNGAETSRDFLDAPAPGQLVLPARIVPGTARLLGRAGCAGTQGFSARVRGRQMARLVFLVDGHAAKTVSLGKDARAYDYRVGVSKLSFGRHTLTVKVTFSSSSHTRSKTLRMTFERCAAKLRAPRFTG